MRSILSILFVLVSYVSFSQDLTGTWEGEMTRDANALEGIRRTYRIKWEIVQIQKEVFGIVYFYPQDTRPGDQPNVSYTWYGKQGKKNIFPFQFIQGRYVEGAGTTPVFQFNVKFEDEEAGETLSGNYYYQLEALNSRERPAGFYTVKKVSGHVSDDLWLKKKEKEIIEKLQKQEQSDK
jgi:hypothetical protein